MITPKDIEKKEFSRGMRGYKEEEVDDFLDLIILDLERLIKENKVLKTEVVKLKKEVDEKKEAEESVVKTLEAAKALMNDISASSERRAQVMLKNAELDAELLQREARESVKKYTDEGKSLLSKLDSFRMKYKQMLQEEMDRVDGRTSELVSDFEAEFLGTHIEEEQEIKPQKKKKTTEEPKKNEKNDLSKTMVIDKDKIGQSDKSLDKTIVNVKIDNK